MRNLKVFAHFCRQLLRLLEQGINLREALLLIRDIDEETWSGRITRIVADLDAGMAFGESLQKTDFPDVLVSFVLAGEQHNGLIPALKKCEWYYRRKYEVQHKLRKALVYPIIVLLVMIVAFIVMQTTVLPRFATLYDTMNIPLPWYTELLLTANRTTVKVTGVFLLLIILFIFLFLRRKKDVRVRWHQLSSKLPLIQKTWQLRFTSIFSWQLGLMLQAGIPLIQSLEAVLRHWPWELSKKAIGRIRDRLLQGESLYASFLPEAGKSFHILLPRQLAIGEASGRVAETLLHSGEMADERLEERVQWLLRFWEPLLILVMGMILAAMVLALFVPMLSLVDGL